MEIYLEQIKANDKFHENNLGFVDSGFVKTCDELVIERKQCGGQRHLYCYSRTNGSCSWTFSPSDSR